MSKPIAEQPRRLRCAIYTRKSSEEGLDQEYNSLGTSQTIRPGDVNLMSAGTGIAHSERTGVVTRAEPHTLAGIQSPW